MVDAQEKLYVQQKQIDQQQKEINLQNDKLEDLLNKVTELEQEKQLVDNNYYWKMLKVAVVSAVVTTVIKNYLKQ